MKIKTKIRDRITDSARILLFPVIASVFFSISCKHYPSGFSKAEMKAIVEKQNEMLGNCFTEGDAEKLSAMYTDSAKLSPNGSGFIIGRDSIKEFWIEDFMSSKVLKMKTHVLTVDGDEDLIYETGKSYSQILYNDSVYNARVKYINVWRRQPDGSYKLDVDFWNRDSK